MGVKNNLAITVLWADNAPRSPGVGFDNWYQVAGKEDGLSFHSWGHSFYGLSDPFPDSYTRISEIGFPVASTRAASVV